MASERKQLHELLYQALETEMGGAKVYENAPLCATNEELRDEWIRYLAQTHEHVRVVRELCEKVGLDPETDSPGRQVMRHIGESLVAAITMALNSGAKGPTLFAR